MYQRMKISKLLVVGISMLVGMAANAKNMISIHTDNVQLVLEVKSNGRLYQAYLGEKLSEGTPLSLLFMPQANQTWPMPAGNGRLFRTRAATNPQQRQPHFGA